MTDPDDEPNEETGDIIEFPLPSGKFPKFAEIDPNEFAAFVDGMPLSDERKQRLVERFIARWEAAHGQKWHGKRDTEPPSES